MRFELPGVEGAPFNISPDALWGVAVIPGLTRVWTLYNGQLVATHPTTYHVDQPFGDPTVVVHRTGPVKNPDRILIGDSAGFVRTLSASFQAGAPIKSIALSADGLSNLILDASGSAFTLDADSLANPVFLSQSGVTAIATNAEASLVATGGGGFLAGQRGSADTTVAAAPRLAHSPRGASPGDRR